MRCTSPRKVGFQADGKTLAYSQKSASKEFASFALPCGKCIACRLEYGRQWAVRAIHESQMHDENCFITLTYSDANLPGPRLHYPDWQNFMKNLRHLRPNSQIGAMAVGEYGSKTKRPHWHAVLFGYRPRDLVKHSVNDRGDVIWTSQELEQLWKKNDTQKCPNQIGDVTFHSAGYVARYSAKKLDHGKDGDHDYTPIFRPSSKYAIGKKWLERYWPDVFNHGRIVLPDGNVCGVPRYYEKWFKENHPNEFFNYLKDVKAAKSSEAAAKAATELAADQAAIAAMSHLDLKPITRNEARVHIQKQRFDLLQAKRKD